MMMKGFALSVASFAALSNANVNDENTIIRSQTQDKVTTDFTISSAGDLKVTPEAIFKEDEGESYLRITFELTKNIEADKVVEILMIYSTQNQSPINPVDLIYYDAVSCMLQQNSQDTRFWTQTVKDGYYNCADFACNPYTDVWNDDSSPSDVDWTAPIEDDDPYDRFCTTTDSSYVCTSIKCIVERKFDTGYTDDFKFIVGDSNDAL